MAASGAGATPAILFAVVADVKIHDAMDSSEQCGRSHKIRRHVTINSRAANVATINYPNTAKASRAALVPN
jgi:hypothetical protein